MAKAGEVQTSSSSGVTRRLPSAPANRSPLRRRRSGRGRAGPLPGSPGTRFIAKEIIGHLAYRGKSDRAGRPPSAQRPPTYHRRLNPLSDPVVEPHGGAVWRATHDRIRARSCTATTDFVRCSSAADSCGVVHRSGRSDRGGDRCDHGRRSRSRVPRFISAG
jgi:hypothetical protein